MTNEYGFVNFVNWASSFCLFLSLLDFLVVLTIHEHVRFYQGEKLVFRVFIGLFLLFKSGLRDFEPFLPHSVLLLFFSAHQRLFSFWKLL